MNGVSKQKGALVLRIGEPLTASIFILQIRRCDFNLPTR